MHLGTRQDILWGFRTEEQPFGRCPPEMHQSVTLDALWGQYLQLNQLARLVAVHSGGTVPDVYELVALRVQHGCRIDTVPVISSEGRCSSVMLGHPAVRAEEWAGDEHVLASWHGAGTPHILAHTSFRQCSKALESIARPPALLAAHSGGGLVCKAQTPLCILPRGGGGWEQSTAGPCSSGSGKEPQRPFVELGA